MIFDRKVRLTIGNRLYRSEEIDIDFNVEFDSDAEPKIQEISIYNLSENSRNEIVKGSNVILNAGYGEDVGTLLLGNVSDFQLTKLTTDYEMKLYVVSNLYRWSSLTISKSYRAGTRASQILRDILNQFGIEIGEFSLVNDISYVNGRVVNGMLKNTLEEIVRECGSRIYVINNIIYITRPFTGTVTGFVLSGETGMIGSPERIEVEEQEGYKIRMLLNHRINVNSVIQVRSSIVSGDFLVVKGKHTGDFITEVEVIPQ